MSIVVLIAKMSWISLFVLLWLKAFGIVPTANPNVPVFFFSLVGLAILTTSATIFMEGLVRYKKQYIQVSWESTKKGDEDGQN